MDFIYGQVQEIFQSVDDLEDTTKVQFLTIGVNYKDVGVWSCGCGCGCFSKYFLFGKTSK